ncbi:MAG: 30S ribosomal protein S12 methylthiotransferase RimO [Spirochaetaceae bacterium]|nr:MAG: 30S ribosomal protein S12 methylthiotransferase RimO [Spirochaetaceae bacterium]
MTFFIESLGCAKNQVDSEFLIASLEAGGLRWVQEAQEAQIIIVNTCGFITSAKDESIQTSLSLKSRYPDKKVIMLGCLVQRYGPELEREMGEIDGFVGLDDLDALWRQIRKNRTGTAFGGDPRLGSASEGSGNIQAPAAGKRARSRFLSFPGSAYVKVAEGCSNHCSYCAIPLIRGELHSRPADEILAEIKELLGRGVVEIILIAQDLASYGQDRGGPGLVALVKSIIRFRQRFWLRLLYLHPDHFPQQLLDVAAADRRVLPYFDIPFQHASKRILAEMGRRGSAESYAQLIRDIRKRLPDSAIRSTFLVGFPGENDDDLDALLTFQRDCALDWVGVFAYSREEGTAAYTLSGGVGKRLAEERKRAIEQNQIGISEGRLDRRVGHILDVLIEEHVQGENLYLGRGYLQAPEVDGLVVVKAEMLEPGKIYPVRIERRVGIDLEASLV